MTDSLSRPIVLFLIDVQCLQCARPVGTLRTRRWPARGPVAFQPAGKQHSVALADRSRLRCDACGGNIYADEVRTTTLYPRLSRDDLDLPRRGRPPAWLVAQRQAAQHSTE